MRIGPLAMRPQRPNSLAAAWRRRRRRRDIRPRQAGARLVCADRWPRPRRRRGRQRKCRFAPDDVAEPSGGRARKRPTGMTNRSDCATDRSRIGCRAGASVGQPSARTATMTPALKRDYNRNGAGQRAWGPILGRMRGEEGAAPARHWHCQRKRTSAAPTTAVQVRQPSRGRPAATGAILESGPSARSAVGVWRLAVGGRRSAAYRCACALGNSSDCGRGSLHGPASRLTPLDFGRLAWPTAATLVAH